MDGQVGFFSRILLMEKKTAEAGGFGSLAVCTQFEGRSMTLRIRLTADLPLSDDWIFRVGISSD
jgi:hypothetical protein